jgi:uncharacterized protein (DUF58 family)
MDAEQADPSQALPQNRELKRFFLLGVLAFALVLAGLGALRGEMLLLALPLVVYLAAGILWAPLRPQLQITRHLQHGRFFQGSTVTVRVEIVNEGAHLEQVRIEDPVARVLKVQEGETCLLTSLPPGGKAELAYTVVARRGAYHFPHVHVAASDLLGLYHWDGNLAVHSRLIVYPEVPQVRRVNIRPQGTLAYAGPIPARRGGPGVEFFGVREYHPGDPLRWVNWKASARSLQTLYTNEFEQDRVVDVGLILDTRTRSDIQVDGDSLFEHAVQATAGLSRAFLNDGDRVGLLMYGRVLEWTFPGYGKVQQERILQALARAEPGESMVFDRLDNIPVRFFPPRSQLILISPLFPDDVPMLVRLRARGYALLIVSPDPISFEAPSLPQGAAAALGQRLASLERAVLLRRLRQSGIQTLDWPVDRPLDLLLRTALGRAPSWYRAVGVTP